MFLFLMYALGDGSYGIESGITDFLILILGYTFLSQFESLQKVLIGLVIITSIFSIFYALAEANYE